MVIFFLRQIWFFHFENVCLNQKCSPLFRHEKNRAWMAAQDQHHETLRLNKN